MLYSTERFITAANACATAASLSHPVPHPVRARKAQLIETYAAWVEHVRAGPVARVEHQLLTDGFRQQDVNFATLQQQVLAALTTDPAWGPSGPDAETALSLHTLAFCVTAPLMFWQRPHAILELTPTLAHWLLRTDINTDIPADALRLPCHAVYVPFSAALQDAIPRFPGRQQDQSDLPLTEGVYLFEHAEPGQQRRVSFCPVLRRRTRTFVSLAAYDLQIHEEQGSLSQLLFLVKDGEVDFAPYVQALQHVVAKLCLFMTVPQGEPRIDNAYSDAVATLRQLGEKKASKRQRHIGDLYDRLIVGPQGAPADAHTTGDAGNVTPHWRRGHFRMQPHGPNLSLRKVIFIAPVMVRADKLGDGARDADAAA